ncbi:MAG: bifunctional acetate--CoA ligase family protein/GNAT family N-acetyltransferase [Telluria sp.]
MSVRNLDKLFAPQSVALIGASARAGSVGANVLRNLLAGGFRGPVWPVNPKYNDLAGVPVFRHVDELPAAPDLAVICTPPPTVPAVIRALGERGTRAAVVLTAGMGAAGENGRTLREEMLDAAAPYLLRVLGPNCVGMLAPALGLNASFACTGAAAGSIAFVSQSGALVTAVLDWARDRGIGFSHFISLGDSADVDFGDVLDYLASDGGTSAILLYMEDVKHARKFMSAARAAARSKPVVVLKAGRVAEGARAAASHTGALAGADDVYDAAIRRAGMLRVLSTEEMFTAVETLARAKPLAGPRLAIMTNGGGPGVMATDALVAGGGTLAALSPETLARLDASLPPTWSHANPVDIIGDAPSARYRATLEALLAEPEADAVLFIHAPTAIVDSARIAQDVAELAATASRNVLSCWMGGTSVADARRTFEQAGVPVFDTPEDAVEGFLQIVRYRRNQELLMQAPASTALSGKERRAQARAVVQAALDAGRTMLRPEEANAVLSAYGVPVAPSAFVANAEEAAQAAAQLGLPLAAKIVSPQVTHKSDVGGVALDLDTPDAVRAACERMRARLSAARPDAQLEGFFLQRMVRRAQAHELIVGATEDPVFGPVILFGQGGVAVEVTADRAVGLAPLDTVLARDMVQHTRVARLLAGYRDCPAADLPAIERTLVQVGQLVADLPEVKELDINPLLADTGGVLALDARVRVAPAGGAAAADRLVIRPYPEELEQSVAWQGGTLTVRPIRPDDGPGYARFFAALTEEDVRFRMFVRLRELSPQQLARFTQIDYDREMALVAVRPGPGGAEETLGVVRVVADPDNVQAEFAVTVRSDLKGQGLGHLLMEHIIAYCRTRGTQEIVGEALPENRRVIALVRSFGFSVIPRDETVLLRLPLSK